MPTPDERIMFYRNKCLSCHTDRECGLMHAERIQENPQDNCVACHMPQVPTDIPHFAFTHHRIQKNRPQQSTGVSAAEPGTLVPLDDVSRLPRIEQDRCLGLAYWQLSIGTNNGEHAATFSRRARDLLESVQRRGLSDPEVDAALASCYSEQNPRRAIELAESAAASSQLSPASRIEVLWILGSSYFDLNETDRAIPPLEELVRLHRNAEAWLLLDVCNYRAGNKSRSLDAARRAAQISPYRPDLQARLADLYRQAGNGDLSEKHSKRKMQLLELDSKKRK
jgi:tetratricopeptide (TPR) repeat protein